MAKTQPKKQLKVKMNIGSDLSKAMTSFKTAMTKKYSEGDEGLFYDHSKEGKLESIPTGSAVLDYLIGNGGLVTGRIHEIFGENSSGKSSLCTLLCANARRKYPDKFILYADAEQACNISYMQSLGLDPINDEGVIVLQSPEINQVFDVIMNAVETGGFSLIIVDSVPALMTKRELNADFGQETMAEKARFLSSSIPKLLELLNKNKTTLVFINQIRSKVSLYGGTTTAGGKALPFYCSTRIQVNSTPSMRIKLDETKYIGQTVEFTVAKNKVGPPFGVAESNLYFGVGFDPLEELITIAKDKELIVRRGSIYDLPHDGINACKGNAEVIKFYNSNPDKLEELRRLVNESDNKVSAEMIEKSQNNKIDEK